MSIWNRRASAAKSLAPVTERERHRPADMRMSGTTTGETAQIHSIADLAMERLVNTTKNVQERAKSLRETVASVSFNLEQKKA